ncbi:MAG: hypothetical protein MUE51_12035 [Thermoleophilia bacterium]|jgi:hypothetical protein|nr:hypothetical protein [Thermoleophilia bacterium]
MPHAHRAQQLAALAEANRVRGERARARREMTLDFARHLVSDPPAWAEGWRVESVLRSIPGFGSQRITTALRRAAVVPRVTLGELGGSERLALLEQIEAVAPPRAREAAVSVG